MSTTKTSKKNAVSKPRLTLLDLQPIAHRVTLTHPDMPELTFWVDLNSREHSLEYALKAYEYSVKTIAEQETLKESGEEMSIELFKTVQERAAELVCICIKDWDAEAIGVPYNREIGIELLSATNNLWIRTALESALEDKTNFFKKA